jgi:hypothetical protein
VRLDDERNNRIREPIREIFITPLEHRRIEDLAVRIALGASVSIELRFAWQHGEWGVPPDKDCDIADAKADRELHPSEAEQLTFADRAEVE